MLADFAEFFRLETICLKIYGENIEVLVWLYMFSNMNGFTLTIIICAKPSATSGILGIR
jgi:hypothetical protein